MPKGTVVTASFGTAATNGWSNTDNGMVWTTGGAGGTVQASDWQVAGGFGTMSQPATAGYRMARLATFDEPDVDLAVSFKVNRSPVTGAPIEAGNLALRGVGSTLASATFCLARVRIETTGSLTALIFDRDNNTLGSVAVPGVTFTGTSQLLRMRVQAIGKIIRVKAWDTADSEPVGWPLTVVDDEVQSGWVGVRVGVASGNTNTLPVVGSFTNFQSVQVVDFEHDKVPVQVLAAFGADLSADWTTWTWTDITSDVLQANGNKVTISPMGRSDEFSQAQPAGCGFVLKNVSGDYTAYDPTSKYYPNVRRNTPIWVLVGPATRFFGYANGWTPTWDASGRAALVSVSASGSLRRLIQGKNPLQSTLYRAIIGQPTLRAYWPMEDPAGAVAFASAVPGGALMTATGTTNFASDSSEPGSNPLPVATGTSEFIGIVSGKFTSQFQADWYYKIDDPTPNEVEIFRVFSTCHDSSGNRIWFDVVVGGSFPTVVTLRIFTDQGVKLSDDAGTVGTAYFGQWVHARLMVKQSSGNILWQLVLFPLVGDGTFLSGTLAGTVGGVWALTLVRQTDAAGLATGHWAVYDNFDLGAADQAQSGFTNESMTSRLTRLCDDNGIPLTIIGTSTATMGPQTADTLINLLRECEAADLGVLYDGLSNGLTYVTRTSKENLSASLTLDATAAQLGQPFGPVDDDQRNRNLYTVSRKFGSAATYQDEDGPMGTAAIGVYDSSTTVNLSTDDPLHDYASWLVHLGTIEGFRYPTLSLNLRRAPALAQSWLATQLGGRIDVTNVSNILPQHPTGAVSLVLEGYTEGISETEWTVQANCSPYQPWRIAEYAADSGDTNEFAGRYDTEGSTLASAASAGATSLSLATTGTWPLWTTDSDNFPLDLNIAGVRVTVNSITGTTSPQTADVDGTTVTMALPSGADVSLWDPPVVGL